MRLKYERLSPTSFKLYLAWSDAEAGGRSPDKVRYPNPITADRATRLMWKIRWTGIQAG